MSDWIEAAVSDMNERIGWEAGQRVLLSDHRGIHLGKTATLVERRVGVIAGRPYWIMRLESGAITSEFEDSLERAKR